MKINLIILSVMFVCNYSVFADIAPNPIRAKGIVTSGSTDVRMVSEKITVDLFQDHSEVECLFFMKNEGKKETINIGFPEMSFHHFTTTRTIQSGNSFMVLENDKKVELIDLYTPGSALPKDVPEFDKQPWYLWFSEFNECETKVIKVSYSLPFGAIKTNPGSRYFTYLLNTGAGWKGTIDTAEVIVNLKDISADSLLTTTPANYRVEKNRVHWKFHNLEPTTNDDIKITYKSFSGIEKKKRSNPTFILDGEIVPPVNLSDVSQILTIKILKDSSETQKYTSNDEGVVIIYTEDYATDRFRNLIASKISKRKSKKSSSDLMKKYKMVIDTTTYENDKLLMKVLELKKDEIKNIQIRKDPGGKTCIQIQKL